MMRFLALLLLLACGASAWGATYYFDNRCPFNGNGTGGAGACAVTGGAAGAYNVATGNLVWGTGNTFLFARGTTWLDVPSPSSGASNTLGAYGTGACPIISKAAGTFVLSISGDNVTLEDLCFTGSMSSALVSTVAANTVGNRLRLYDNAGAGVGFRFNSGSTNGTLTDTEVSGIYDDGVGISTTSTGTVSLIRLTCHHVDLNNATGDCVQLYDGGSASLTISGGRYTKETGFKQAIRFSGSGTLTVKDQPQIYLLAANAQGISVDGSGVLDLRSVFIKGTTGAPLIFTHNSGASAISGAILIGGDYGVWSSHATGALTVQNSDIIGASLSGVYHTTDGAGGTLNVWSNYIDAPVNINDAHASATTVADYNRFGPSLGTFALDGVSKATLASWQSSSSQDANSMDGVTPPFVGGASPTTPAGFRLTATNTFQCAGKNTGLRTDYFGRGFEPGCTPIGAAIYGTGDARSTALPARTTPLGAAP